MPAPMTPDPKKLATAIVALRVFGCGLLILAALIFTNTGKIVSAIGLNNEKLRPIIALIFAFMGLVDVIVLPIILTRAAAKSTPPEKNPFLEQ